MKKRPIICTYYFPNWHVDPRNEKIHGKNWTEWRVTQYATPRFSGHEQPKVPLWGYDDEANPVDMARKIQAAADHGIDAFIFDWYYFKDGSYRERCLQEGFLKAENCNSIKFALMWANHDPIYAHPGSYLKPHDVLWSGDVNPETFLRCTEHCITEYMGHPNYLRVNDGLYFSIYRPKAMAQQLGGEVVMRMLLDDFRFRVEKAGLGKLTIDADIGNSGWWEGPAEVNRFLKSVGFDTGSDYQWPHKETESYPALEYSVWAGRNADTARIRTLALEVPYNPVVPMGWDSSPRTVQSDMYDKDDYPFGPVIVNNTPSLFEKALRNAADFLASDEASGTMLHLPCWNEWTEGAYLEPDTVNQYGYLEAVEHVFGIAKEN